ncbi:hypothetical protein Hanom_Chr12g01074211 [Helianthus anomalus]
MPGSVSFSGSLFKITAETSPLNGLLELSPTLSLRLRKSVRNLAYLGMDLKDSMNGRFTFSWVNISRNFSYSLDNNCCLARVGNGRREISITGGGRAFVDRFSTLFSTGDSLACAVLAGASLVCTLPGASISISSSTSSTSTSSTSLSLTTSPKLFPLRVVIAFTEWFAGFGKVFPEN